MKTMLGKAEKSVKEGGRQKALEMPAIGVTCFASVFNISWWS